jgi:hypothetical protein
MFMRMSSEIARRVYAGEIEAAVELGWLLAATMVEFGNRGDKI